MTARESFVARFGEADAVAIETASQAHMSGAFSMHGDDNLGSEPFKYHFLNAIGYECVGRYRESHGIAASAEDMQRWALDEGDLGSHDGDVPDYLALICGTYTDWIKPTAADA